MYVVIKKVFFPTLPFPKYFQFFDIICNLQVAYETPHQVHQRKVENENTADRIQAWKKFVE